MSPFISAIMFLKFQSKFVGELGHNMGMSHDFDDVHGGQNGQCNGQGFMSYGNHQQKWSTCSKNDFLALYNHPLYPKRSYYKNCHHYTIIDTLAALCQCQISNFDSGWLRVPQGSNCF